MAPASEVLPGGPGGADVDGLTKANEGSSPPPDDNDGKDGAAPKKNVKKRTKTGCLTCRKRRIKCDEGRPICNNCIKSKRHCEGYNQRVVFKNPLSYPLSGGGAGPTAYNPHSGGPGFDATADLGGPSTVNPRYHHSAGAVHQAVRSSASSTGPLPIAPKPGPVTIDFHHHQPYAGPPHSGPGRFQPGPAPATAGPPSSGSHHQGPLQGHGHDRFIGVPQQYGAAQVSTPGWSSSSSVPTAQKAGPGSGAVARDWENTTIYNFGATTMHPDNSTASSNRFTATVPAGTAPRTKPVADPTTAAARPFVDRQGGAVADDVDDVASSLTRRYEWQQQQQQQQQPEEQEEEKENDGEEIEEEMEEDEKEDEEGGKEEEVAMAMSTRNAQDGDSDLSDVDVSIDEESDDDVVPRTAIGKGAGEASDSHGHVQGHGQVHHGDVSGQREDVGVIIRHSDGRDFVMDTLGTGLRTFSTYVENNVLANYDANPAKSPLNDPQAAAIFAHFINVTGPSMSLYERHPFDPHQIYHDEPIPRSRQHIWTYTFPIISFNHPALLQAMLALGALQIAKLENVPPTAALKHYHLALRRIARNVKDPQRRTQPPTLAAALLMAYFEVWSSDHEKWCKHLFGARILMREIAFHDMTRAVIALKRRRCRARRRRLEALRRKRRRRHYDLDPFATLDDDDEVVADVDLEAEDDEEVGRKDSRVPSPNEVFEDEVDTELLSALSGHHVDYSEPDDYVLVDGDGSAQPPKIRYTTDRDIETYEHLADLYWWYGKMDVYQSILGGTKLLMDYSHWTQCPPRAPIGRLDAIYGTYDHVMLLLARLANFASRDLSRKRKAMQSGGGPPGAPGGPGGPPGGPPGGHGGGPPPMAAFFGPGAGAGRGPGGSGTSASGGQSAPMLFAGMLPTAGGRVTAPMGFSMGTGSGGRHESYYCDDGGIDAPSPASSADTDEIDMESATADAFREWNAIREAFDTLRRRFGPEFEPLANDYTGGSSGSGSGATGTPFGGPALQYRTYSIAGIWLNYYMGLIALHRAHPSMPPFAMVAAGMAAQQTAPYAYQIGRIAAGISEECPQATKVSTLTAAALLECCFCLFVAAVQFRETSQRHWTIRRLHDINRLTGWQSARQIADGCESAWTKAAQLGKGPPYSRPADVEAQMPKSIWDNPRRIDQRISEIDEPGGRVVLAVEKQAFYALGLLGVEQDMERLELKDGLEFSSN